jgi:hypothetical protein
MVGIHTDSTNLFLLAFLLLTFILLRKNSSSPVAAVETSMTQRQQKEQF